jgi:hypothetical protein
VNVDTNLDVVDDVYIPPPNIPVPMENERSNEDFMMEHREHEES